jgi:hypothetical protein
LVEIIKMDVNRCFHDNPYLSKESLTRMLM